MAVLVSEVGGRAQRKPRRAWRSWSVLPMMVEPHFGVRCQAVSLEPIGVFEQVDVRDLVDAERAQVVENVGAQRGLELPTTAARYAWPQRARHLVEPSRAYERWPYPDAVRKAAAIAR